MQRIITTAKELHLQLIDFILDAEGDLAQSLEAFSAEQLANFSQSQYQGAVQNEMVLNMFLTEGTVGDKKPIDVFLESHPDLSAEKRDIVNHFKHSFAGLFAVNQILEDGFELTNWLTNKQYTVKINEQEQQQLKRAKEGEILLARIVPVFDSYWM
ncbi:MAG: hypothetical protein MJK14_28845, partial [Rivularia sp. ALOHA_DT_140]|nr:hypothetical protein [Rivularia sp. ALOHA_DT_140]